ncbi:PhoH family protein [Thermodesulfovibrio sp.]|uniref:PhoH family protein n=1 Tax=Thermodesulfovibrio sp. TaxID=2067987 RepID=UPI0030A2E86C
MKKTYVLDTNVLIHDPDSIFNFEDNTVVIPYPVIEELDSLKKNPNGKAYAARKVIRYLNELINANTAVKRIYGYEIRLPNHGQFVVTGKWYSDENTPNDELILRYFRNISNTFNREFPAPVIFVTKDISFRIRITLEGFIAQDYQTDKSHSFQKYGEIKSNSNHNINSVYYIWHENELYKIKKQEKFRVKSKTIFNILPRTADQLCALDALLDNDIDLVVLNGFAGTGKTLLALTAGIYQVIRGVYERVIVMRPVTPIQGTDIGYLPGDVKEKLSPWMQPIYDNLDIISLAFEKSIADLKRKKRDKISLDDIVQIEALTFIRGRSLPDSFIIIDEAQNLRPLDVKTIVTRAGEGTKIVFTGDLEQIDTPYLDATSSGIAYLVDRFIEESNFCYLNLKTTVRSKLAEQGVRLL